MARQIDNLTMCPRKNRKTDQRQAWLITFVDARMGGRENCVIPR